MKSNKFTVGDLFFMPQWPQVIYRIHRVHGSQIYYLRSHYGCNPPRGIIQEAHSSQALSWVRVERNYNTKPATLSASPIIHVFIASRLYVVRLDWFLAAVVLSGEVKLATKRKN